MGEPNPKGAQRCHARSKTTGQQCRQAVVPGATVCHYHGGAAPQVKEAAQDRLRALQHPAIDRLAQLIDQDQFPTVALGASKDVLDRTLGRAAENVTVTHGVDDSLIAILDAWKVKNRDRHGA